MVIIYTLYKIMQCTLFIFSHTFCKYHTSVIYRFISVCNDYVNVNKVVVACNQEWSLRVVSVSVIRSVFL